MKQEVLIGQTDYTVLVKIRDDAGAPATGLTEASIDIAYARVETDNDVTTSDVTPAALTALTDAHTDWGFEEVSATDHPGLYRLDIADAVFASGAWSAVVTITGTGLDPADMEFVLVAFNPRDGVRLGLTALPNAAADAAGGLIISDAGGLDADAQLVTKINDILTDTGTTLQGELDGIQADTEDIQARLPAALTADGNIKADTLRIGGTLQTANDVGADVDAILIDTAEIGAAGAGLTEAGGTGDHLTAVPWNAAWDAEVQSEVDDALIANNLDHLCKTATAAADMTVEVADNTILSRILSNGDTSVFDPSTDGLQPLRDHVGDGTNLTEAGGTGDHLTAVPWNASWDTEVQSEVQDAIEANHLDHLIAVADPGGVVANSSFLAKLTSKSATPAFTSYNNTTDSLEALRDRGDAAWVTATGFATAAALATAQADLDIITGTAGALIDSGTGAGQLSISSGLLAWNPAWDAEVQSEVDDALVAQRLDELLNADSDIDGAAPPTVGSVFHELMTKTAGSFTYDQTTDSLEAVRDRGDAAWTTATGFSTHSAADVWSVATRVLTAATNITSSGSAITLHTDAKVLLAGTTHTSAVIPTVSTLTGHTAQTGDGYAIVSSGTHGNAALKTLIDTVDTIVDAIKVVTDQIVAARAEPTGVPAANEDPLTKLDYLFMALRNKLTVTASKKQFFNDGGTAEWEKDLTDDGTTYTETEANAP